MKPTGGAAAARIARIAARQSGQSVSSAKPTTFDPTGTSGPKKAKAPGILDQAKMMVLGAPRGLFEFGKEAIETATAVPHIAFDAATGNLPESGLSGFGERYIPAVKHLGEGFVESAQDVMHPERFAEPGMLLPKLVNLAANVSIAAGGAGKVLGTVGEAGAIGAEAGAKAAAEAATRGAGEQVARGVASEVAPVAAEAAPTVIRKGLAGLASRGGAEDLARGLSKAGDVARTVSSYGAQVGNAPAAVWTKPLGLVNRGIGQAIGERALPFLSEEARAAIAAGEREAPKPKATTYAATKAIGTLLNPEVPLGPVGKLIPALTPERRQLSNVLGDYQGRATQAGRDAINALRTELPEELQTTTILSLDQRMQGLNAIADRIDDSQLARMLDDSYAKLEPSQRPSVAEARKAFSAMRGELPDAEQEAIGTWAEQIRREVDQRTEAALNAEGTATGMALEPGQVGNDLLESVVNNQLAFLKGQQARQIARREAVSPVMLRKIAEKAEAENLAERAMRGEDVIPSGEAPPKAPPINNLPRAGEVRSTAKQVAQTQMEGLAGQVENLLEGQWIDRQSGKPGRDFAGARPRMDSPTTSTGVEDWALGLSEADRRWLRTEGWVDPKSRTREQIYVDAEGNPRTFRQRVPKTEGERGRTDVWAEMARRYIPDSENMSDGEVVLHYVELVRELREIRALHHPNLRQEVADRLGLLPDDVGKILAEGRQGITEVSGAMADELARLRDDFMELPADQQGLFEQYLNAMKGYGADEADYAELIDHFVPGFGGQEGLEGRITGRVPIMDVADYLLRESDPTYRPATPREVARMNRAVGALLFDSRQRTAEWRKWDRAVKRTQESIENVRTDLDRRLQDRVAQTSDAFVQIAQRVAKEMPEEVGPDAINAVETAIRNAQRVKGGRLDMARRVREALEPYLDQMTDKQRADLDKGMIRWQSRRNRLLAKTFDRLMEAAPARFRPAMTAARDNVKSLIDMAEEAPDSFQRDHLLGLAEEIQTNLSSLVKDGIDPTHLIGGQPRRVPGLTGSPGTAPRKVSQEFRRTEGFGTIRGEELVRNEVADRMNRIRNETLADVEQKFGRRADQVVEGAEDMAPNELREAAEAAGFRALRAPGMKGGGYKPDTVLVPKPIHKAMSAWDKEMGPAMKALAWGTGKFKTNVLPLSPRWHVGNVVGNVLMAQVYGGVSPIGLATELVKMRKAAKEAGQTFGEYLASQPSQLMQHGLTHGERLALYGLRPDQVMKEPRTPFGRTIQRSYNLNEAVDSIIRSAVYRAHLGRGVPSPTALSMTLKAMGDFTRLSPYERRVLRQIVPFYPWVRHQTQAMMRLPIEHPARAVFLGYLANLYNDPSLSGEERKLLGLKFDLPGLGTVDLGFMSPLPTIPTSISQAAQYFTSAVNPLIKEPVAQATGYDIGQLKQIPRPKGTIRQGAYGPQDTSLLGTGFGGALYHAAGVLPGTRAIRGLVSDPSIQRYATGEQVGKGAGKPSGRNQLLSIAGAALGVPVPEDTEDLGKRMEKLRKTLAKQGG